MSNPTEIEEVWRPIDGYEGIYDISNLGRVRSIQRTDYRGQFISGRIKRLNRDRNGYVRVHLSKNGKSIYKSVHGLVAKSFIGDRPTGYDVNHIDGDKENNRADNLEYCTTSENIKHAYRLGKRYAPAGERNPFAKLTNSQVLEIRNLLDSGATVKDVSKMYGVCFQSISQIKRGVSWKFQIS